MARRKVKGSIAPPMAACATAAAMSAVCSAVASIYLAPLGADGFFAAAGSLATAGLEAAAFGAAGFFTAGLAGAMTVGEAAEAASMTATAFLVAARLAGVGAGSDVAGT